MLCCSHRTSHKQLISTSLVLSIPNSRKHHVRYFFKIARCAMGSLLQYFLALCSGLSIVLSAAPSIKQHVCLFASYVTVQKNNHTKWLIAPNCRGCLQFKHNVANTITGMAHNKLHFTATLFLIIINSAERRPMLDIGLPQRTCIIIIK